LAAYEDINEGDSASRTTLVDEGMVSSWAALTGDDNPVHLDDAYASRSFFRRKVAHGLIPASLVAALLGTRLPGPGSIYLSQTLDFRSPVFPGDSVTARVTVLEKDDSSRRVRLSTQAFNQGGVLVLDGEAWVLFRPRA
jgi:acyl dehydratase